MSWLSLGEVAGRRTARSRRLSTGWRALVVLHPAGPPGRGGFEFVQARLQAMRRYQHGWVTIAPDGDSLPASSRWDMRTPGLYRANVEAVREVIRAAREAGASDVTLLGQSSGAYQAARMMLLEEDVADRFVIHGCTLPRDWVEQCTGLDRPVFMAHGVQDRVVPFDGTRDGFDDLHFLDGVAAVRDLGASVLARTHHRGHQWPSWLIDEVMAWAA